MVKLNIYILLSSVWLIINASGINSSVVKLNETFIEYLERVERLDNGGFYPPGLDPQGLCTEQIPINPGVAVLTDCTYIGFPVYAIALVYPEQSSVALPVQAEGKVLKMVGIANITVSRGMGVGPFQNIMSDLSSTVKTNVSGNTTFIHVGANIEMTRAQDGNTLHLVIDRFVLKGKPIPFITVNFANCYIWFI